LATSTKTAPLNLFAKVSCYSFNEAAEVQERDMPGSEPKTIVSHQSALAYFM